MYLVKWLDTEIGTTALEKGDAPMGVAFGEMKPISAIENTLGQPMSQDGEIKGWEGCDVFLPDGSRLDCHTTYLEQYDLGAEGRIYKISCIGIERDVYEELFQHHIEDYENSFN